MCLLRAHARVQVEVSVVVFRLQAMVQGRADVEAIGQAQSTDRPTMDPELYRPCSKVQSLTILEKGKRFTHPA